MPYTQGPGPLVSRTRGSMNRIAWLKCSHFPIICPFPQNFSTFKLELPDAPASVPHTFLIRPGILISRTVHT